MTTVDLKQWEEKVKSELRGKPWDSAFTKRTADGIAIPPVYTAKDRNIGQPIAKSALNWQRVWLLQPESQNKDVLEALSLGVDTLWIRFELNGERATRHGWNSLDLDVWKAVFEGVHLSMLNLVIEAGDSASDIKALFEALSPNHPSCRFVKDVISEALLDIHVVGDELTILSSTALAQLYGATPIQELELHLRAWAMALERHSQNPERCANSIQIQLPADAHIFETVAKFRTIRQLWHAFWGCAGVSVEPKITALTSPRMMSDIDEYTNILRSTHAATAAIMGGCDQLCILPFDYRLSENRPEAQRMSAIIHAILEEESFLGSIQDPMSGSYYIESLTEQLSEQAWENFRQWSRTEGHSLLGQGIRAQMSEAQQVRIAAIAHRQLPLTSISAFPKVDLDIAERAVHWTVSSGQLSYDSDVFTNLRRRLLRHSSEPTVHIVCIGQESQWTARYHFTLNAFAVGGWRHQLHALSDIEALGQTIAALPSDAPVCLCAPNEIYGRLKTAGWSSERSLFLAGAAQHAASLGAKPIYLGCDLQQILQRLCDAQEAKQ